MSMQDSVILGLSLPFDHLRLFYFAQLALCPRMKYSALLMLLNVVLDWRIQFLACSRMPDQSFIAVRGVVVDFYFNLR